MPYKIFVKKINEIKGVYASMASSLESKREEANYLIKNLGLGFSLDSCLGLYIDSVKLKSIFQEEKSLSNEIRSKICNGLEELTEMIEGIKPEIKAYSSRIANQNKQSSSLSGPSA